MAMQVTVCQLCHCRRPCEIGAISQQGFLRCRRQAQRRMPECHATKKTKAFGEWLIETDDPESLDQPPDSDFWEGPQFEFIGQTAGFAVPLLLVLLILVGFFAASNYNSGATAVLQPPTSPEDVARIISNEDD